MTHSRNLSQILRHPRRWIIRSVVFPGNFLPKSTLTAALLLLLNASRQSLLESKSLLSNETAFLGGNSLKSVRQGRRGTSYMTSTQRMEKNSIYIIVLRWGRGKTRPVRLLSEKTPKISYRASGALHMWFPHRAGVLKTPILKIFTKYKLFKGGWRGREKNKIWWMSYMDVP